MKKLILALTLTIALTACSEPPNAETPETPETTEPTNTFSQHPNIGYYGELIITGYATIRDVTEAYGEKLDPPYTYVSFEITETENSAVYDFLAQNKGNSFLGDSSIGLGCLENGTIEYFNESSDFGYQERTIPANLTTKILNSTEDSPIILQLTRHQPTAGSQAPSCYSHFAEIEEILP